jgi:nucleotide-binding universal stress UspA family protein
MNYTTSRILVPHDGSEMSDKALNKAIEFATALKSEMIILHVIDDTLIPQGAIIGFISEKSTLEDAKTKLLKLFKIGAEVMLKDRLEKAEKNRINVRLIMGMGSPAEGIADVAKNENVDLIIMGSKGVEKNNTSKLKLLGSVARRVSEIAECAIMIIK